MASIRQCLTPSQGLELRPKDLGSSGLDALGFRGECGEVEPLPRWARFLIKVGRYAVETHAPGRRLVLGVSLPTRAFAAAFTTLGVTAAAYVGPEKGDVRDHFNWLVSLPRGTAIRFRRGRYLYCARLLGAEVVSGIEHLAYQAESKCLLPWDRCLEVQPLDPSEEFVRRRPLAANAPFVEEVLGLDPLSHAAHTSVDCLVIGVKDALRSEVLDQQFYATARPSAPVGVLNDLLRCDAYELNANDHDRTTVISGFSDDVPERLRGVRPPAVVFDGPTGYLRLRRRWNASPWIVLLDRTSPLASAAGDAFNQDLAMSIDDADLSSLGEPPDTFEVRGYIEVIR
jgi:hypothetical protein